MKKCDLHIHTVPTASDAAFSFSLEVLTGYVEKMELDVIAITNHNMFDMGNFLAIRRAMPATTVLPGIEVNLEGGHILVIASPEDVDVFDFNTKCETVSHQISVPTDNIRLDEFRRIFGNLSKYVLIPHYDKAPHLPKSVIDNLSDYVVAGEVASVKKFLYMQKDQNERLTPLFFSDFRCSDLTSVEQYPVRQTYLDINEVNVSTLNICLRDKSKATLSAKDGNKLFNIFSNGQMLSTGLNIMYGRRSTGKTWTLNKIAAIYGDNAKYIKQFELQNFGQDYTSEQFESDQKARLEGVVSNFLSPFKHVVEDIAQMPSTQTDEAHVDDYLKALLKRSEMENIKDVYSNSSLYDEITYSVGGTKQIRKLVDAVIALLEGERYQDIINRHISTETLVALLKELINKVRSMELHILCKNLTNDILTDVKNALQTQTALPAIPTIDLYEIAKRQQQRKRFLDVVNGLKHERVFYQEKMDKFRIILKTKLYGNATEVKSGQGIGASLVNAYYSYNDPLAYLQKLIDAGIDSSKLHKLFVGIQYRILNENGYRVSGGERSEFTFLQKIKDARTKEILLIDEPESSFDNVFLKRDINKFIKEIAKEMPVVISTHNNTIGGSISPDYILYTEKTVEDGEVVFHLYSGNAGDPTLCTVEGKETDNYIITIDSLEAGEEAYKERYKLYGILRDQEQQRTVS